MSDRSDDRPITFICFDDGSGFEISSPGGDLAEGTGSFEDFPLLTVDLDTSGQILTVAQALVSDSGTLESTISVTVERTVTSSVMRWTLSFTHDDAEIEQARLSIHPAESRHRENLTLVAHTGARGEVLRLELMSQLH